MAIFPKLQLESTLQTGDKSRLDATKSFISTGEAAITLIEIEPEASAGYTTVTSDQYLDWSYSTTGEKTVTVRITTDGSPTTATGTITVVDATTDNLFSGDAELVAHEPDILSYIPEGRNSFLNVHRLAQDRIMTILDEKRIWDTSGDRLTKSAVTDIQEVNDWSKFLTLSYIFEGLSNDIDDIFFEKASRYRSMSKEAESRAAIKLDFDGDGTLEASEDADLFSMTMVRR